ncbi:unnamed protein product [Protopolystoma xenopodis]|uniref:RING-type domain-containing protein n=1 Tax=Protopolystoma xenopodis TaxID=117903 RepID=A0A3S5BDM9_9PLAT|nr:unnamed protein product [Protopolystoma xenopodis]
MEFSLENPAVRAMDSVEVMGLGRLMEEKRCIGSNDGAKDNEGIEVRQSWNAALRAASRRDVADSVRKTPCGHFFHTGCLRRWLAVKAACPLCMQPIDVMAGVHS